MILPVSVQNWKRLDQYKMKTLLFLILYCLVVTLAEKPKETNQDEKNQEQQKNELILDDQEHLQLEKKEKRSRACHPKCGTGFFHAAGKCNTKTGRCACHWGWTGPRSKFVSKRSNRIEAKFCTQPCHYTHNYRYVINLSCLKPAGRGVQ